MSRLNFLADPQLVILKGKDSEEVEKLLYYMEHSMLVRFAVLEFFFKYKNENEKFIKKKWGGTGEFSCCVIHPFLIK